MERRFESCVTFNETVLITPLLNDDTICTGRLVDVSSIDGSSDDMRIKSSAYLEVGTLVRLEVDDDLMMTEVRHCEPEEREYSAGLLILSWLEKSELKRLLREAVVGPTPQPIPDHTKLLAVA